MSTGNSRANRRSAVEKVLEQDDVIARRVDALKDAHGRLEAAFEAILAGEEADAAAKPSAAGPGPVHRLGHAGQGRTRRRRHRRRARSRCLPAMAGRSPRRNSPAHPFGAADPDYVGSIPPRWQEEAARAQALLSRASLEVGLDSQGNRDLVAFQLAQAIGPNLDAARPRAARICVSCGRSCCSFGEEPLAQTLYLGTSGAPLALYAKKGEETIAPSFKHYGDIGGVAWSQGGHLLSPRRRGRRGVAAPARRGDQESGKDRAGTLAGCAACRLRSAQAVSSILTAPCAPRACSPRQGSG